MKIFSKENVKIIDDVLSWEEAFKVSGDLLVNSGNIDSLHIDEVIKLAKDLGPIFDVGDSIAIPHCSKKDYVLERGVSMVKLNHPFNLLDMEDHPIDLVIFLATRDSKCHLKLLRQISELIMDSNTINLIKESKDVDEILNLTSHMEY